MKVAITGAAGYLGRIILKKLIKEKRVEKIVAIDRVKIPFIDKKVDSVVCDITSREILKFLKGVDAVIHLAFIIGSSTNKPLLYRINVEGAKNVFESSAKVGVKRIIVASSIAVYGYYPDNKSIIYETHPLRGNPENAYSDTKVLVEILLDDFEKRYPHIGVIRFRPGVILGKNTKGAFRMIFEIPFWIEFSDTPGFWKKAAVVHEEDVADAFILGIFSKKRGAYNLAAKPFITREHILERTQQIPIRLPTEIISKLMDLFYKLKISPSPSSDLYFAMYPIPASAKKAISELGWKPKYTAIEALEELLETIKNENRRLPEIILDFLSGIKKI